MSGYPRLCFYNKSCFLITLIIDYINRNNSDLIIITPQVVVDSSVQPMRCNANWITNVSIWHLNVMALVIVPMDLMKLDVVSILFYLFFI